MTFEEAAHAERDRAALKADTARARSAATNLLFEIVGKVCRDENERDSHLTTMRKIHSDNHITDDELASYEASLTLRPPKATQKQYAPFSADELAAAKNAATEYDQLSKSEQDAMWRNAGGRK